MQLLSSDPVAAFKSIPRGEMRDQSKAINQKEAVPIGQHAEPAFSAAIVGRDSMGSDLLVNALVHNLRYDAIAIQSSNLLQVLGARVVSIS